MKVEMLVNLKIASGKVIPRGATFSDKTDPIPDFVMRRLQRGMARIIEEPESAEAPLSQKTGKTIPNKISKGKTSGSTPKSFVNETSTTIPVVDDKLLDTSEISKPEVPKKEIIKRKKIVKK